MYKTMKRTMFIIVIFLFCGNIFGQNLQKLKKLIDIIEPSAYPYLKPVPVRMYTFHQELWGNLPVYVWRDMRGKNKINIKNDECSIYKKFKPTNGKYDLILFKFGEYLEFRHLLATFDSLGRVIDQLEVGYSWDGIKALKQFHLTDDMQVVVYHLQVNSDEPVDYEDFYKYEEKYATLNAQRHDYYYQITPDGKFEKIKQIDYQPKEYPRSEFFDTKKQICDGDEIPIGK